MELINTERYRLSDPAVRERIVAQARAEIADIGAAAFPDFVHPGALAQMVREATARKGIAHRRDQQLNFNAKGRLAQERNAELANWLSPYKMWILASDLLEPQGAVRGIYESEDLLRLVKDALDLKALHRVADPMISVNVTYMSEGDQHGWHFDDNDFVVSILLQVPQAGGVFEFAPRVTNVPGDEAVQILRGTSSLIRRQFVTPGTLLLFRGREALHRVTPVIGAAERMIALLSYHTEPGFIFPEHVRVNGLGRAHALSPQA